MKNTLPKNKPSKYRLGQRSKQPILTGKLARKVTACIVAIVGVSLIILGISASIQAIQSANAFSNTARSIQGTVETSDETIDPCGMKDNNGNCQSITTCSTTVYFTLPDHTARFYTTDTKCGALDKGAKVEVLYDPHNPHIAKTARQASSDTTGIIIVTIIWPIVALSLLFWLVRSIGWS